MILDYQSILNTPILNFSKRELLGAIHDVIIHPDTGKIEAFWVKSVSTESKYAILQSQDILRWTNAVYIEDASVIAEPDEIIRITEILNKKSPIVGNRVENKDGQYYGRVISLCFNTETFYLTQIDVRKQFMGILTWSRRLFPFSRIIKVLPSSIVIDDNSTQEEKVEEAGFIKDSAVDPA